MKNNYEIRGKITAIKLNSSKYGEKEALISTKQLERVNRFPYTWYAVFCSHTNSFYVHGRFPLGKGRIQTICLHRWITRATKGCIVDHINHETLDNTDRNLRIVTHSENSQNRKGPQSNSTSGYRGVYWDKKYKKWAAGMQISGKKIFLGHFEDIEEANQVVSAARDGSASVPFKPPKKVV